MSYDKAPIKLLRSALEKSERLDELGRSRALEKLKDVYHSLSVKNHKRARKQLEDFTRQLVDLIRD